MLFYSPRAPPAEQAGRINSAHQPQWLNMREPSYYMSSGRLFILVEVTNRPTHPQPVCPYHHHHHYHYYCSCQQPALTSLALTTVAMGAGRDNGRRWRQLLGHHCVCVRVAPRTTHSWWCRWNERRRERAAWAGYWLGRDALATPTLRRAGGLARGAHDQAEMG